MGAEGRPVPPHPQPLSFNKGEREQPRKARFCCTHCGPHQGLSTLGQSATVQRPRKHLYVLSSLPLCLCPPKSGLFLEL